MGWTVWPEHADLDRLSAGVALLHPCQRFGRPAVNRL